MLLTSSQREASHADTRNAATRNSNALRVQSRIDVIPDQASSDVHGTIVRVVYNLVEPRHGNLDSSGRRKSSVASVSTTLDPERRLVLANNLELSQSVLTSANRISSK